MINFKSVTLWLLPFALNLVLQQLVLVECKSTRKDSSVSGLNQALDGLLLKLYGDIEPRDEILWNTKHAEHVGDDNAIHYSNEWLVYVQEKEAADRLAAQSGYENLGELKEFPGVYLMRNSNHPRKHKRSARELTQQLQNYPQVVWADQQFSKFRVKRDPLDLIHLVQNFKVDNFFRQNNLNIFGNLGTNNRFQDPLWEKQWYMQDTRTRKSLPRLDLNVLPVFSMGYTGKGVKVVVLDDGLEHSHMDISPNYVASISGDLNDNDNDPTPHYGSHPDNSHGTRCAGEIAMVANNSVCGVGIAYNAGIGGVRMLDGPVSDRVEGEALSFAVDQVDVYSASWGPNDDGQTVEGPGRLAQRSLIKGITQGRKGKGIIYVWASGNGGSKGDCCSCDGYTSSIFTLSIGSASESGAFPWYGEKCPSTMAVTYSSGAYTDQKL
ncbi:Neuroendocrine convertase 1 [Folsomia candida]|uniref:Neuroendocrine convertase 1 n=2 Tax=Folsomia candida TaxID=158441 RepID=A0A226F4Y3_FOLCA|nr:Neuroendocrine convertase 1 [Folsomia candida]